ncbi:hypothetical protein CcI49_31370 [Frankia sp. CcI49]|uniref:AAA family ATPase n=1 Tax=unclassified Frankia TaxID=2632575 RepID=UPI0006CA5F0B|nr:MULTISPECIES: LuxR family transcriptional regulator [unclassified Frankia]ONH54155.1 hypothetical protein CcI49_31370 [Frankia sp. CcI49]
MQEDDRAVPRPDAPHHDLATGYTLVERDRENTRLSALLTFDRYSPIRVAVIEGAAGHGKSVLAAGLARQAEARGFRVLTADGAHRERALPFGIVSQLLPGDSEPPGAALGAAITATLADREPDARDVDRALWYVTHTWCAHLVRASASAPILLIVDDAHHADRESLTILVHLLRRSRAARIAMLFTVCADATPADPAALDEVRRRQDGDVLRLAPLTEHGVATVVGRRLGPIAGIRLAPTWHQVTGGSPLLVHALIEDQKGNGRSADDSQAGGPGSDNPRTGERAAPAAGERFRLAVLTTLDRIGGLTTPLARSVAVLGRSATPRLLDQLTGLGQPGVVRALRALHTAGILTARGLFRHPAAQDAVLASTDAAERRRLNSRAAVLLNAEGCSATVVAQHLLDADSELEPWAVPVLENAAREACNDGDPALAAAFLRLALRAADGPQRDSLTAELAALDWWQSPRDSVRHLSFLVNAARVGRLSAAEATTAAQFLLWHGRFDEATTLLADLVGQDEHPDTSTRIEIRFMDLWLRSLYPEVARQLVRRSPRWVDERSRDLPAIFHPRLEAATQLARVLSGRPDPALPLRAEQIIRRTVQTGSPPETISAASVAALALLYAGHAEGARRWFENLLRNDSVQSSPTWGAKLLALRAEAAMRLGQADTAGQLARGALSAFTVADWGVGIGLPLGVLVRAMTVLGRHDEASELLDHPIPANMFQTGFGLHYLEARGRHRIAIGLHRAALDDFRLCGDLMRSWGTDVPTMVPWRDHAAEALLGLGEPAHARRLLADNVPPAGRRATSTRDAGATAGAAASDAAASRHPAGRRRRDTELGPGTGRGHAGAGASSRVLTSVDRMASLSEAEQKVAARAARGQTNREIAAGLFITVSTVEQHLTRTYRKLRVAGRKDLANLFTTARMPIA